MAPKTGKAKPHKAKGDKKKKEEKGFFLLLLLLLYVISLLCVACFVCLFVFGVTLSLVYNSAEIRWPWTLQFLNFMFVLIKYLTPITNCSFAYRNRD